MFNFNNYIRRKNYVTSFEWVAVPEVIAINPTFTSGMKANRRFGSKVTITELSMYEYYREDVDLCDTVFELTDSNGVDWLITEFGILTATLDGDNLIIKLPVESFENWDVLTFSMTDNKTVALYNYLESNLLSGRYEDNPTKRFVKTTIDGTTKWNSAQNVSRLGLANYTGEPGEDIIPLKTKEEVESYCEVFTTDYQNTLPDNKWYPCFAITGAQLNINNGGSIYPQIRGNMSRPTRWDYFYFGKVDGDCQRVKEYLDSKTAVSYDAAIGFWY